MSNEKKPFNIFEEHLRGVMYRGGPEAENAICAYVNFSLFMVGAAVVLIALSSCCQRYYGRDLMEIISGSNIKATTKTETAKGTYILDDKDDLFWVDQRGNKTLVERSPSGD